MQPNPLHEQIQSTGINKTRGLAYGRAVREVWAIAFVALQARAQAITQQRGKFTIVDLAQTSLEFGLSFKLTAEFLEELGILPRGTYERLRRSRGYRVATFLDAAKERAERQKLS
jgi:membrane-anchored protein YejM (alkaline phosphatase superfamily)